MLLLKEFQFTRTLHLVDHFRLCGTTQNGRFYLRRYPTACDTFKFRITLDWNSDLIYCEYLWHTDCPSARRLNGRQYWRPSDTLIATTTFTNYNQFLCLLRELRLCLRSTISWVWHRGSNRNTRSSVLPGKQQRSHDPRVAHASVYIFLTTMSILDFVNSSLSFVLSNLLLICLPDKYKVGLLGPCRKPFCNVRVDLLVFGVLGSLSPGISLLSGSGLWIFFRELAPNLEDLFGLLKKA